MLTDTSYCYPSSSQTAMLAQEFETINKDCATTGYSDEPISITTFVAVLSK